MNVKCEISFTVRFGSVRRVTFHLRLDERLLLSLIILQHRFAVGGLVIEIRLLLPVALGVSPK